MLEIANSLLSYGYDSNDPFKHFFIWVLGNLQIIPPILIIIFILWLYFNIGNLTRLTDIKYKLDEIQDAIRYKEIDDDTLSASQIQGLDDPEFKVAKPNLAIKLKSLNFSFKKPSKLFIWIIGVAGIVFTAAMIAIYFIGR